MADSRWLLDPPWRRLFGCGSAAMSFPAADYYGHPRASEEHENAFFDDMHSFIAAMARRLPSPSATRR